MYYKKLLLFILVVFFILPLSIFSATEVSYPNIPGSISPQNIIQQAENEEDVLPLFLTYIFNLLLIVSAVVAVVIIIYGSFLFFTASDNPERKQDAKKWILSALQGATIVLLSYTILFTLDSRLVLFQSRNLDKTDRPEEINMEWDLKTPYFQIPVGLLIEDAILNNNAESKFYDVLNVTENAEEDLDKIIPIGQEMINIMKMCPVNRECCGAILLANVEEMMESNPHVEGGVRSWNEVLEKGEDDEDFLKNFIEAVKKTSGRKITKEDIDIMALLEKLGFDPTSKMPSGEPIISSGVDDDGNVFLFYGTPEEEHNSLMLLPQEIIDEFKKNFDVDELKKIFEGEDNNELSEIIYSNENKLASLSNYYPIKLSSNEFVKWDDPSFKKKIDQAKKEGKVVPSQEEMQKWKDMGYGGLIISEGCANPWNRETEPSPEEIPEESDECPPCLIINPMIMKKIAEMQVHIDSFSNNLNLLSETKKPLNEDLYQIYKVVMLKSLGYENVINYPTLLFEKRIYDYENIVITTDDEKTKIGKYIWSWEQWIDNIIYTIVIEGQEDIKSNDPVTFYLKENNTKQIIEDALSMTRSAKEVGFQNIDNIFSLKVEPLEENNSSLFKRIISFFKNILQKNDTLVVFAETPEEKLKRCIEEKEIDIKKIDFLELLDICEIEYENSNELLLIRLQDPSDFLRCGMEIPVGETIEITWNHIIEILNTIDEYIEMGKFFIERQSHMNELAAQCECPCENESCPDQCGGCQLTCNLGEIISVYNEILEIRASLEEIAERIRLLTFGHFNVETKNLCDPLNEDIRSEEEKELCLTEDKLITNHELITRKLNYSRHAFNECTTLPEDIDDIYEGKKSPKLPVFGPIAEKKNLDRYTKTTENNEPMNTSNFNWFCCEGI